MNKIVGDSIHWYSVCAFLAVPNAPPVNLAAESLSPTVLNITWQPPAAEQQNGIIRSYMLSLSVFDTGRTEQFTSNQTYLIIEGLHPFYMYSIIIAAVTIGPGPLSEAISFQMPQAGKQ